VLLFVFGKSFAEICLKILLSNIIYTSIIRLYAVCFWIRNNQRYSKPVTFLHGTNHDCTVVSHMCRCNTLTVTGK